MKITLYHGSTLSIEHPLAKVGRADLDFGRGFYLTSLRSQAEQWAARVQLLRASTTAWINVYEFDMDAAIKAGFKLLRFDAYDQHWLNFIVASRNGKQPWKDYDIIEGGVANDRVIDTIEDYLNDIITIEHALGNWYMHNLIIRYVCSISNSLIHIYILIIVFHWILWTEKEVTNERTSTLEKNQSHRPIIISPIGDKPGKSIKSVL